MKGAAPMIAVGVGVAMLCLSAVWPLVFPASRTWTEEKAQRMAELSGQAHELGFKSVAAKQRPGGDPVAARKEYEAVRAELDKMQAEFENQKDAPNQVATWLRWAGAAVTLLGGAGVLVGRNS